MSHSKADPSDAAFVGKMTGANVAYKMWLVALPLQDVAVTFPVDESCRACYARHYPQGEQPYSAFREAFHAAAIGVITGLQEGRIDPWDLYDFFADARGWFDMAGIPTPPAQFSRRQKGVHQP